MTWWLMAGNEMDVVNDLASTLSSRLLGTYVNEPRAQVSSVKYPDLKEQPGLARSWRSWSVALAPIGEDTGIGLLGLDAFIPAEELDDMFATAFGDDERPEFDCA